MLKIVHPCILYTPASLMHQTTTQYINLSIIKVRIAKPSSKEKSAVVASLLGDNEAPSPDEITSTYVQ